MTVFAAMLLAPVAAAHQGTGPSNEHGELNVTLAAIEGGCEVTIEGRHVENETGVLEFVRAPSGPGGPTVVLEEPFDGEAEGEGGGFRFEEGPFAFESEARADFVSAVMNISGEDHSITVAWDFESCRVSPTVHVVDEVGELGTQSVDCDFFAVGRHLREDAGNLQIFEEGNLSNQVHTEIYTAEPEDDGVGFTFTSGPIHLEPGTYRPRIVEEGDERFVVGDAFEVTCETPRPDCPEDVEAEALADGGVRLTWSAVEGADGYRVYRRTTDSGDILLDETTQTEHVDDTAAPGVTYRYRVSAFNEGGESRDCQEVEVTAVPFFGAPILGALALLGAVGALVTLRRR